jgi:HAD superfamily hydrolase (TIGR01458 family)
MEPNVMSSHKVSAFLIDLDGVIYVQEKLIPGAIDAIRFVQQKNLPHRFVTNSTTHSRRQLTKRLAQVGLEIIPEHLFTAPVAAAQHLKSIRNTRCYFYVNPNIVEEFEKLERVDSDTTHVIIGDVGERFNYEMMNRVFFMIQQGADIVALQKNRFCITREGLKLDAGAFIAALEYATGKTAKVFGKPSAEFFHQACASLGLPPTEVTMIGDDLRADIEGAAAAGLKTIFVRSGKDQNTSLEGMQRQPDLVLNSIAELPAYLMQQ